MAHLRRTRGTRRSRHHTQKTSIHGQSADAVSISERPPAVEDRALPGHWEGDLLFGSKNSQIATLVERQSRYVMLVKVGKKDTEGDRPLRVFASEAQRDRSAPQRTAEKDAGLRNASTAIS